MQPSVSKETIENPYGLEALWRQGDFVSKGTLIILVIMSMGSWYIMFVKLWEQQKLLREGRAMQGTLLEGRLAAGGSEAPEGLERLPLHRGIRPRSQPAP